MSIAAALLASCFVVSAPVVPTDLPATPVGAWELTGVGGQRNLVTPERMVLAFDCEGEFRTLVWEQGAVLPQEVSGRYRVLGDAVELVVPDAGPAEAFQVTWSPSLLVLQPVESERPADALWFEKRPGQAP